MTFDMTREMVSELNSILRRAVVYDKLSEN